MPQFFYRGRDKNGNPRSGERLSFSEDTLNTELIKEGITPTEIKPHVSQFTFLDQIAALTQNETRHLEELSIFARQMHLLHKAGVPMTTSIQQIASFTRSHALASALNSVVEYLEKGEKLSLAMQHYPRIFSKLMINIVQIGENTGHLSEAFGHLHSYLEFEAKNRKQIQSSFRYPLFVATSIFFAMIILNLFVIPTFSHFYVNISTSLPWQTQFLIDMSSLFVNDGKYILILLIFFGFMFYRYLRTSEGRLKWDNLILRLPLIGKLQKRMILIRLSQSMSIILNSGISVTEAITLSRDLIQNTFIKLQMTQTLEAIERGNTFTQAIGKIKLFTPLELQIISVGEKNGELGSAMSYIGHFHSQEIEFDLKRMNDWIGPILITAVSVLILIIAMGIYLPIWNMVNLSKYKG